jgi:hypothetical protein
MGLRYVIGLAAANAQAFVRRVDGQRFSTYPTALCYPS